MSVRWTAPALGDLASIGLYIAQDSPKAAERMVLRIRGAVEILAEHPHLGRASRRPNARELVVSGTPYLALYRVRREGDEMIAEILRIFHGARDWR